MCFGNADFDPAEQSRLFAQKQVRQMNAEMYSWTSLLIVSFLETCSAHQHSSKASRVLACERVMQSVDRRTEPPHARMDFAVLPEVWSARR